jgi:hypothetical protein
MCGAIIACAPQSCCRAHPPFGASFDSKITSREAAKNAKGKAFYGFYAPSLKEYFSATEFGLLRVLRGFT